MWRVGTFTHVRVQVHNALGFAYLSMDRAELAVTNFRRAVDLQPGYVTAWNNLGDALERRQEWAGALDAYERSLSCALLPQFFGVFHACSVSCPGHALDVHRHLLSCRFLVTALLHITMSSWGCAWRPLALSLERSLLQSLMCDCTPFPVVLGPARLMSASARSRAWPLHEGVYDVCGKLRSHHLW